jgi:hypothetical protein
MITLKELLCGHNISDIEHRFQLNLEELLKRINIIRSAYNKPMTVTSAFRSEQDHLRIYSTINAKRVAAGLSKVSVPMASQHLSGSAVDISDPNRLLQAWCSSNVPLLESVGLWMEDFSATPTWCHFQINPPKSGNRFFKP